MEVMPGLGLSAVAGPKLLLGQGINDVLGVFSASRRSTDRADVGHACRALFAAVRCLSACVGKAVVYLWPAPTVRPYSGSVEGGLRHVYVFREGTG
jgi:hypothetical protein